MSARVPSTTSLPASKPAGQAAQPFKSLLEEARRAAGPSKLQPVGAASTPKAAVTSPNPNASPRVAVKVTATVRAELGASSTRAHLHTEAKRLETVRAHHDATAQTATTQRTEATGHSESATTTRMVELIVKELVEAFETAPGGAAHGRIGNPVQPLATPVELPFATGQRPQVPEVRAAQAVALIERIDTFVKSQRPALALTLNNSLGARVEIEKLGPGRIALRLVGQNGPPSAESVSRIREELSARGLKIGALSVA